MSPGTAGSATMDNEHEKAAEIRTACPGNKLEAVGRTTFQLYWTKTGALYGMTASSAPCTRTKPLNSELFRRNYFPHQGAPLFLKSDSYFRFLFLIRISRSPSYRNAPKLPTTRMLSQDSTQRTSLYASHPPARRRRRRRRPPTSPRAAELGFFRYKRLYFRYIIQHFIIYHEHDLVIYRHMTIMSAMIFCSNPWPCPHVHDPRYRGPAVGFRLFSTKCSLHFQALLPGEAAPTIKVRT